MSIDKELQTIIEKYKNHPEFLGIEVVEVNQKGAVDDTLLHLTARTGDIEGLEVLIVNGADIDAIGDLGNTPLHQAAMMGQLGSVKKLVQLGANINLRNEFGQTVYEVAMLSGHQAIIDFLETIENEKGDVSI